MVFDGGCLKGSQELAHIEETQCKFHLVNHLQNRYKGKKVLNLARYFKIMGPKITFMNVTWVVVLAG